MSFHLNPLGDLIALAAALMWAVYSILIKKYTEQYDNFLVTRRVSSIRGREVRNAQSMTRRVTRKLSYCSDVYKRQSSGLPLRRPEIHV